MVTKHSIVVLLLVVGCGGKIQARNSDQLPELEQTEQTEQTADAGTSCATSSRESSNLAECDTSPLSIVECETQAELEVLLIGCWQRCIAPQARGEDVGVEFAKDGRWYALTRDARGNVVRRLGIDYGGTWAYLPRGSIDPISNAPSDDAFFDLDSVITNAPTFTNEPRQMRILFSPVQSRYLPMD